MTAVAVYPLYGTDAPYDGTGGPEGTGATRLNAARIVFENPPRALDAGHVADALNPDNWTLAAIDPASAKVRLVQHVERESELQLIVWFDGDLDAGALYELQASADMLSTIGTGGDGGPATVVTVEDGFWRFYGFTVRHRPAEAQNAAQPRRDIANPQLASDARGGPIGTLQVAAGGYRLDEGSEYRRKRLLRRATTGLGEFFHLPGYGFAEPLKGSYSLSDLARMQARAQAQLLREPDVSDARVSVSSLSPGVVHMRLQIVDREGGRDAFDAKIRVGEEA